MTAIPAGGANPGLVANPSFATPFPTPPHPEYPSAHSCVSTAIAYLIVGYFGTPKVHFMLDSLVFADGVHTHVFDNTNDLYKTSSGHGSTPDFTSFTQWMTGTTLSRHVPARFSRTTSSALVTITISGCTGRGVPCLK